MSPIEKLEYLTEEECRYIVFGIMNYHPIPRVRDSILREVILFKWIDCESMGLDVYQALSQIDQLIAAGFEWRRNHWAEFFANNDTDGKNQIRRIL